MNNLVALSNPVDITSLLSELKAGGVTCDVSVDTHYVHLLGSNWNAMTDPERTAERDIVTSVLSSHSPRNITSVVVTVAPHPEALQAACRAAPGVTKVAVHRPSTVPGNVVLYHNALTSSQQDALAQVVTNHDPTLVPSLSVDGDDVRVYAADNVTAGTVVVTDSRGAGASGKIVKLIIPMGGDGDVDVDHITLDVNGKGNFNFLETTRFTSVLVFKAYLDDNSGDPVVFTVRRGTA